MCANNRVCVVTINYNGAEDTLACVQSLAKSSIPLQVVVVDNTPYDQNLSNLLCPYKDAKIIQSSENLGFGQGNNLGIDWILKNADCEFVLILNNDATVKPDTIECMAAAMSVHSEAAIVTARIVLAEDESKLWYGGGEVDWLRGAGRVPGVLGPADAPVAMRGRYVSFASGCAMMIRRDVLKRLGGFDKRFFMYEEDLELSLRVQEAGWKIWYEPSALVSHIGQGSQGRHGGFLSRYDAKNPSLAFLVYHGFKNCLLNMDMHAMEKNRIKFFTFFPLFLGMKSIQWAAHGRVDAIQSGLRAIRDYIKER